MNLPTKTEVNKRIPKQLFYDQLNINTALKKKFVDQISSITWRNKIAESTVNIPAGQQVTEIQVFEIALDGETIDEGVLTVMDKEMPYHIVFLLSFNGRYQTRIAYKEPANTEKTQFRVVRYFKTPWSDFVIDYPLTGFDLDNVYENLVRVIAADELSYREGESLKESVEREAKRLQLQRQINALQLRVRKEKQFNKQVQLNAELKQLKAELEGI